MPTPDKLSHAEMAGLNFAIAYMEENNLTQEEVMVTPGVTFAFVTFCVTSAICRASDEKKIREALGVELKDAGSELSLEKLLEVRKNALKTQ